MFFEKNDDSEYYDIILTDIALHMTKPQNPTPWYRAMRKAIKNKKPGRYYIGLQPSKHNGKIEINLFDLLRQDPKFKEQEKIAKKLGKEIRIYIPPNLPIYAGKDTLEKIEAEKRKRTGVDKKKWSSKIKHS